MLEPVSLLGPEGQVLGQAPRFSALALVPDSQGRLLVRRPQGEGADAPGSAGLARLAGGKWVPVAGDPAAHAWRLAKLARSRQSRVLANRLLAGRVEEGDTFPLVEMAWGLPQRSFMVNYFSDEQHYVYLVPGRKAILLRFVGGRLGGPFPVRKQELPPWLERALNPR